MVYDIDISHTKQLLNKFKTELIKKCPDFDLKFDKMQNMTGTIYSINKEPNIPILCLYHNNSCISSIQIEYDRSFSNDSETGIEISSYTSDAYMNRGFNKLLRAIIILLAPFIKINGKNVTFVSSSALSPVSAWLLLKYYNGKIVQMDNYVDSNKKPNPSVIKFLNKPKKITLKYIKELYNYYTHLSLIIIINLTKNTIEKAYNSFDILINTNQGINCNMMPIHKSIITKNPINPIIQLNKSKQIKYTKTYNITPTRIKSHKIKKNK